MSFQDKSIQCCDCGTTFVFTAGEQEFYQNKGYTNEPKRCPSCRSARKAQQGGGSSTGSRQMYPATCAACGKETTVPFEPRGDKPVYCRDCFTKTKGSSRR